MKTSVSQPLQPTARVIFTRGRLSHAPRTAATLAE
jgi:hypothetical protein